MKKGEPINDVTKPTGNSHKYVRAIASAPRRMTPPNNPDIGKTYKKLDPQTKRTIWGMTRPTKPTRPEIQTAQAVKTVAISPTNNLNLTSDKPRDWLVSSSSNAKLSCFANISETPIQTTIGIDVNVRSSQVRAAKVPESHVREF